MKVWTCSQPGCSYSAASKNGNTSNFGRHIINKHPERLSDEDYQKHVTTATNKKRKIDQTEMIKDDAGIMKVSWLFCRILVVQLFLVHFEMRWKFIVIWGFWEPKPGKNALCFISVNFLTNPQSILTQIIPKRLNREEFHKLICFHVVTSDSALISVEGKGFLKLMHFGYPHFTVPTANTVRKYIVENFEVLQKKVIAMFKDFDGNVSWLFRRILVVQLFLVTFFDEMEICCDLGFWEPKPDENALYFISVELTFVHLLRYVSLQICGQPTTPTLPTLASQRIGLIPIGL